MAGLFNTIGEGIEEEEEERQNSLFPNNSSEEERTDLRELLPQIKEQPSTPQDNSDLRKSEAGVLLNKAEVASKIRNPDTRDLREGLIPSGGVVPEEGTGLTDLRTLSTRQDPIISYDENIPSDILEAGIPTAEPMHKGVNIANFLFGDEMGVLGFKLDSEGLDWEWENAKQQWSEAPLWLNLLAVTSLAGTIAFPIGRAALTAAKAGGKAGLLAKGASRADEIAKYTDMGWVDDASKLDDEALRLLRLQEIDKLKYQERATKLALEQEGKLQLGPAAKAKHIFEKSFANEYQKLGASAQDGTNALNEYKSRLDSFWKAENIGAFFATIPDEKAGERLYSHWLNKINPSHPKPKLSAEEAAWADTMFDAKKLHQQEALKSGFITQEQFDKIGEIHVPALVKGTPEADLSLSRTQFIPVDPTKPKKRLEGLIEQDAKRTGIDKLLGRTRKEIVPEGEVEYIPIRTYEAPRLDSPTLMQRKSSYEDIAQKLKDGKLITDPADITMRGYVTDRLLLQNYKFVRDAAMDSRYAVNAKDIETVFKTADDAKKAGYIPLENIGGDAASRLKRMLEKAGADVSDGMPWLRKELYNEVFGSNGSVNTIQSAGDMIELLNTIYKTSKTALSIPTHGQNLVGNFVFMSMAGMNPLAPKNVSLMSDVTTAFRKITDITSTSKKAGVSTRELFDPKTGMLKKINLGSVDVNGKKFNLNDEFFDPVVRELIEESAFESAEGFSHLQNLMGRLKKDQYATRAVANTFLKAKNIGQVGDRVKWFDNLTKWYLGEDMVPKMAMYLNLRSKGLSKTAAVLETGKRLPMYSTTGSAIKYGRKWAFPWATFPAEAMRIMKNNMMDHPLKTMPWLQGVNAMQGMVSAMGGGPTDSEASRNLPMWAQGPSAVLASGKTAAGVQGGLSGAVMGGAGGLVAGGARGAAVGAIGGGIAGALGARAMTGEQHEDQLRGIMLDFLPQTSFMLNSMSPEFGSESLPFKDFQGFLEQMPAEPLAIFKPLIQVISGKTPYGQDVGGEDFTDQMSKTFAGMVGFVSPPWMQKYGFKVTTPDVSASEAALKAMGVSSPGIPGDPTNVARLLIDTGMAVDPNTGKPGSLTHDFILNNLGALKSYSGSPETRLRNETKTEKHLGEVRGYLSRKLSMYMHNADDDRAAQILEKVNQTFVRQHADNPALAQEKYTKWLKRQLKSIGRHPSLRNWTDDEIESRIDIASKAAKEVRSQAREELLNALRDEVIVRKLQSGEGSSSRNRKGRERRSGR